MSQVLVSTFSTGEKTELRSTYLKSSARCTHENVTKGGCIHYSMTFRNIKIGSVEFFAAVIAFDSPIQEDESNQVCSRENRCVAQIKTEKTSISIH